jgi:hypothetical protein
MDEARRVLDRLGRIDGLRRAQASPAVILREVRALLAEGEAWRDAEQAGARGEVVGNGHLARAGLAGPDAHGTATDVRGAPAHPPDGEPMERAGDALAQLDEALAGRGADARDGEVMPKRPAP